MLRERIQAALEELTAAELRHLKAALGQVPLAPGYAAIARSRLEPADVFDLTDLLVGHYCEAYGAAVAAAALRRVRRLDLAEPLAAAAAAAGAAVAQPPAAAARELHFVERHRAELIQRVPAVEPLLDLLLGEVLDEEQARAVAAEGTPQAAMRRLLGLAPAWTPRCKDRVAAALRRRHPALVAELEARDRGRP